MIINQLSEYLIHLRYEDISKEAIEKAKLCFIDYLAVYLRGLESDNAQIAIKTIYELYGNDFNSLNKDNYNHILKLVNKLIKESGIKKNEINHIFLQGNAIRIAKLKEKIVEDLNE